MEINNNEENYTGESGSFDDVGLDEFQYPQATVNAVTIPSAGGDDNGSSEEEHDQLPNVDEYKASFAVTNEGSMTHRKKVVIVTTCSVSMAFVVLLVWLLSGDSAEPDFIPDSPEPAPVRHTPRAKAVATFLTDMGWTDSLSVHTPNTPQYQAAYWLAEVDPLQMESAIDQEYMQRFVLATIYYSLGGPNWSHEVNWMSKSESCKWNTFYQTHNKIPVDVGASCYGGSALKQLYLPGLNLSGELPSELGLLLDLTDLDLHNNKIEGLLPEELKNLVDLKNLRLNQNRIIGSLPLWISNLRHLKSLQLSDNKLLGELPESLPALTQLTNLVLERNGFSGDLKSLSGLGSLQSLYIGGNKFQGVLGDSILRSLKNLEILDASDNALTGSLPADLFAMKHLSVVDLHGNHIGGHLPLFADFNNEIRFLALHDNKIGGSIAQHFHSLKKLEHLDLSKNFFTGKMPAGLGLHKSLKYLFLAFNTHFTPGPIPVEYTTLPNLVDLSLQKTNRNGTIPYEFSIESENLVLLDLNSNALSGTIPKELGSMKELMFMLLKDNDLTGSVPLEFSGLAKIHTILLEGNNLSGTFDECPETSSLKFVSADCDRFSTCKCCTKCCDGMCTELEYFSGLDPIATGNYIRESYNFLNEDPEYVVKVDQKQGDAGFYENYTGYDFDP